MKITLEDAREVGYCAHGMKIFARRYNLDFKKFIQQGYIESEELLKTNSHLAEKVVQYVEAKNGKE